MRRSFSTRLAVLAGVLAVLAAWTHARPIATVGNRPAFDTQVPLSFDGWIGRDAPPLDPDVLRVLAADEYVHRFYGQRPSIAEQRVEMDVAYYARPQAGAAMHSPLNCLPGNGWQVIDSRTMPIDVHGATQNIRRLVVERKGHRVAMAYWFQNRGAVIGNEYQQRFRLLTNGLQGHPTDAALVRVMARDTPAGRAALAGFTRRLIERLSVAFR